MAALRAFHAVAMYSMYILAALDNKPCYQRYREKRRSVENQYYKQGAYDLVCHNMHPLRCVCNNAWKFVLVGDFHLVRIDEILSEIFELWPEKHTSRPAVLGDFFDHNGD